MKEPLYADDIAVGDLLGPLQKILTASIVAKFCTVWGRKPPNRFTDDEIARKEGLQAAIVPGIMSLALVSNLLTTWAPGGHVRRLETLFRRPVPHNETIELVGEVRGKSIVEGQQHIECDVHIRKGEDELVTGTATVILPSKPG